MERIEAIQLLKEALARIEYPQPNAQGGSMQIGGAYWRLAKVIGEFIYPQIHHQEGAHADALIRQHGPQLIHPIIAIDGQVFPGQACNQHARDSAELRRLCAERDHWKANHAHEVARSRILKERPDMPLERVKAYELVAKLRERVAQLEAERVPMTPEQIHRAWTFANTPCEANSFITGPVTFARAIEEHHEISP